ncbi:MAG: UDP-N-acetylmuramate dehydrogenase, partial [Lysobacterales bacterium]
MKITEHPELKSLNTFGVSASAALLLAIEHEEDILDLPRFDPATDLVLGGGSNVVLAGNVPGTVFLNRIRGRAIVEDRGDNALVEVGAGENWHALVRWSLDEGLCGLENLSLIPGQAGAAPIQNIGAYGVELASTLEGVAAWDWRRAAWTYLAAAECRLGYRDSVFRSGEPERYLITSIRLRLPRSFTPHLDYPGLAEELTAANAAQPTAREVSDAVIRIRQRRLPDPRLHGNAGSFFKNPLVPVELAEELSVREPALPRWPHGDQQVKLSAAWLVERCGLKGTKVGGAAVSEQHALVIINRGEATGHDIATLARTVQSTVF